jgi:hypothetical protein
MKDIEIKIILSRHEGSRFQTRAGKGVWRQFQGFNENSLIFIGLDGGLQPNTIIKYISFVLIRKSLTRLFEEKELYFYMLHPQGNCYTHLMIFILKALLGNRLTINYANRRLFLNTAG